MDFEAMLELLKLGGSHYDLFRFMKCSCIRRKDIVLIGLRSCVWVVGWPWRLWNKLVGYRAAYRISKVHFWVCLHGLCILSLCNSSHALFSSSHKLSSFATTPLPSFCFYLGASLHGLNLLKPQAKYIFASLNCGCQTFVPVIRKLINLIL